MTTKEQAKAIRAQIKTELGLNSRQVSVRCRPCTYSMAIDVTVKVPVPIRRIREIVQQYESISRCEASGEILGGGNTFTSVEYDRDMIAELSKPIATALCSAAAGGSRCRFAEFEVEVDRQRDIHIWDQGDDGIGSVVAVCWDLDAAAERLTRELILRGLWPRIAEVLASATVEPATVQEAIPATDGEAIPPRPESTPESLDAQGSAMLHLVGVVA